MDEIANSLQQRILALIARGVATSTSDEEFDRLTRDIFAFQFERCGPYRAYCEHLKLTPERVAHWKEIPAVPTSAFKEFALTCFPVVEAVAQFHTSGTTREKSGKHYLRTLELYEAAIRAGFAEYLLGYDDGEGNGRDARSTKTLPMMVLTASPEEARHSSLSHMMGVVMREFGAEDSAYYVEGGQLLIEKLLQDLCEAQWANQPVFLLGTAFAFVHLFDHLAEKNVKLELSPGSRAMETGGFKGRSREIPKPELYVLFERFLGIPRTRVVNEYGMTELSTQFYDLTMQVGRQTDVKEVPPWARVVIIDPNSGREAANEERGLIRVCDLANLWSMICVQTEDLGIARQNEFEVLGRVAHAEVRGCSLTAEDLKLG
jgi:acyl-protein synthetase LuxE